MLFEALVMLALAAGGDQQPTLEQMRQRNPAWGRCGEMLTEEAVAGFRRLSETYPRTDEAARVREAQRLSSLLAAAVKKLPPSEFLFYVSFFPCAIAKGESVPPASCPRPITLLNTGLPDFDPMTFERDLRGAVKPKHFSVEATEHINTAGWTSELRCSAVLK
jgi:hypothetical protein